MPQLFIDALPSEVIVDLCNTLELGDSDERCRGGDTLSVAFVPDFIARYESGATREQIDREIGTYLVECSEWVETPSDGIFQSCRYDFNGDGAYTILVVYRDVYQPDFTIREGHSGGHIYRVTSQYPAAGIGR